MHSYDARLFGNTFLKFVSNFSLEGGNWVICLHNMFMVLLIIALGNFKIGATNLFFWILVPLGGKGGLCMRGHDLLSLYSSYTKFK